MPDAVLAASEAGLPLRRHLAFFERLPTITLPCLTELSLKGKDPAHFLHRLKAPELEVLELEWYPMTVFASDAVHFPALRTLYLHEGYIAPAPRYLQFLTREYIKFLEKHAETLVKVFVVWDTPVVDCLAAPFQSRGNSREPTRRFVFDRLRKVVLLDRLGPPFSSEQEFDTQVATLVRIPASRLRVGFRAHRYRSNRNGTLPPLFTLSLPLSQSQVAERVRLVIGHEVLIAANVSVVTEPPAPLAFAFP